MGTRRDTPPDRQSMSEQGREQRRERKLDETRAELRKFRDEDFKSLSAKVDETHDRVGDLKGYFDRMIERLDGKVNAQRLVALAAWAIFALIATWAVNRAGTVFDDLTEKVHSIDARTQADWANGRKWGEALDKDVEQIRDHHESDMDRVERQIGRLRRGKPLQEESE